MAVLTDLSKIYKRVGEFWFLDYEKLYSRGARMIFLFGEKSNGKTYGWTDSTWLHYCATGNRFLFLRRRKEELIANRTTMWNDYFMVKGINKEVTLRDKYRIMIRDKKPEEVKERDWMKSNPWELFGFAASIDDVHGIQSVHMDFFNVDRLFLDEFMLYNTQKRLIPNEAGELQTLYEDATRVNVEGLKPVTVAASNAGYMTNPYFKAWGISPRDFEQNTFVWRNDHTVLFVKCPQTHNKKPFEKSFTDTYKKFANESYFLDDNDDLIEWPEPPGSRTILCYATEEGNFRLVRSPQGIFWIDDVRTDTKKRFALNKIHTIPGAVYTLRIANMPKELLASGKLRFSSSFVRNKFLDLL